MEKFIIELVKDNNRVIIPNFGAFIISKENGINILFNNFLSFNDGLLINFVAEKKGIDTVLATEEVFSFVDNLKKDLDETGEYQIKSLGTFKKDTNGILRFFKDPNFIDIYNNETASDNLLNEEEQIEKEASEEKDDLLDIDSTETIEESPSNTEKDISESNEEDSTASQEPILTIDSNPEDENKDLPEDEYGTISEEDEVKNEKTEAEPIVSSMQDYKEEEKEDDHEFVEENDEVQDNISESNFSTEDKSSISTQKEKKSKKSIIILIGLLIIALGVIAYVFIFHKPSHKKLTPAHEIKIEQQKPIVKDTLPKVETIKEEIKKPEAKPVEDKVFIIIGGFKEEQNAINLVDKYQKKGYDKAQIVLKGNFHMVSIDSDVSVQKMLKRQQEILNTEKIDSWIYQTK